MASSYSLALCLLFVSAALSIQVAMLIDYEVPLDEESFDNWTTFPELIAQLQNNTGTVTAATPIQITQIFSTNMTRDPAVLLGQFDVLLISSAGEGPDDSFIYSSFYTICSFVSGGGGIVFHGSAFGFTVTNQTVMSAITMCSPVSKNITDGDDNYWNTDSDTDRMVINNTHPITAGLPSIWNDTILSQRVSGTPRLAAGAVGLSTYVSTPDDGFVGLPNNHTAIAYMTYGSGRSVYVGHPYSIEDDEVDNLQNIRYGTPADQLLRQAIIWAKGTTSHLTGSATGVSGAPTGGSGNTGNTGNTGSNTGTSAASERTVSFILLASLAAVAALVM